jgi:hypothetical protein
VSSSVLQFSCFHRDPRALIAEPYLPNPKCDLGNLKCLFRVKTHIRPFMEECLFLCELRKNLDRVGFYPVFLKSGVGMLFYLHFFC